MFAEENSKFCQISHTQWCNSSLHLLVFMNGFPCDAFEEFSSVGLLDEYSPNSCARGFFAWSAWRRKRRSNQDVNYCHSVLGRKVQNIPIGNTN